MKPPAARNFTHIIEQHGETRSDPYYWMHEKGSEEVEAYLEAENAYTDHMMAHTEGLQEIFFE